MFDFLSGLNHKKLKIDEELFKASVKLGRQKLAGAVKESQVRDSVMKETFDACKEHLWESTEPRFKFTGRKFESLLLSEMKDFHQEYQNLLQKYQELSNTIKRKTESGN